jgi:PAS domain S-box-containing protein
MESAHLGVWEYDAAGPGFRGSQELNRLYGFPPDEDVDLARFAERYEPGEAERISQAGAESVKRGDRFFGIEYRIRLSGGQVRWLLLRAETEVSPEGKALHSLGIVADITERKQAEEQRELLLAELNHRVKNMLAVVLGIAAQTMRHSDGIDEFFKVFSDRIGALSRGYGLLTAQSWRPTSLVDLVSEIVQPHVGRQEQLNVIGHDVSLAPKTALSLSLVLNELATNASKHGALTRPAGRIQIAVGVEGDQPQPSMVTLSWKETGMDGVATPRRRGFGSQLIEGSVKHELKGFVEVNYRRDGVHYEFRFPRSL